MSHDAAIVEPDDDRLLEHPRDEPRRSPAGPVEALLRRWPLALALMVVGAVVGFGLASAQSVTYTSEARVAVGAGDLSSGAIAGFPLAASELASNYARYVNDQALVDNGRVSLGATPIPESNIIRIIGTSDDEDLLNSEVQKTAEALVSQVNAAGEDDTVLKKFVAASDAAAEAEAEVNAANDDLTRLKDNKASSSRITDARTKLATLTSASDVASLKQQTLGQEYTTQETSSQAADLEVVVKATTTGDSQSSLRQRYLLLGIVVGLALALALAVALERRRANGRRHA